MAGADNGQFADLAGARQTRGKMWRGGPKRTRQLGILRDLDSPVTSWHVRECITGVPPQRPLAIR